MRQFKLFSFFFLFFATFAVAQNTTVSGTVTDANGQVWLNGTWSASLYSPNGAPFINGSPVTTLSYNGSMNGSGFLNISLPSNSSISPAGSMWVFSIKPFASVPAVGNIQISVSGTTQDITSVLSANAGKISFPAQNGSYGYADSEVSPIPAPGATYFNTTSLVTRIWNGSAWANQGGGGSTLPSNIPVVATNSSGTAVAATSAQIQNAIGPQVSPFCGQQTFGDSLSWELDLLEPTNGWAFWVAKTFGHTIRNFAIPGTTSFNNDAILFANYNTACSGTQLNTYLIGTNNVTAGATAAPDYGYNILSQYALLALGSNNITYANSGSANLTYTGTWAAGNFTPARQTITVGSTLTFNFTGTAVFLDLSDRVSNTATISTTIDGTTVNMNPQLTPGVVTGSVYTTLALASGLSAGAHTLVVTLTGAGTLDVNWLAGLPSNLSTGTIFDAEQIFDRNPVDAVTPVFVTQQTNTITTLQNAGINNIIYTPTTGLIPTSGYFDLLHPMDYSAYVIGKANITAINAILPKPVPLPTWQGVPIGSVVQQGSANVLVGPLAGAGTNANNYGGTITGTNNTCVGAYCLQGATTGGNNTCIGYYCLNLLSTGSSNSAFGVNTLKNLTTAQYNTAFGFNVAPVLSTGAQNSIFGGGAGTGLTTGGGNTFVGYAAGQTSNVSNTCTTCSQTTFLGGLSGPSVASGNTLTSAIGVGYNALVGAAGAGQLGTGTNATANTLQWQTWNFLDNAGNSYFNIPRKTLGTAIASATTIAPVAGVTHITGTAAITTITPPTFCTTAGQSCHLIFIPDGIYTTLTGGNIAIVSTAVVSKPMSFDYDPATALWYPSY